jgi:NADH-quinone oxidoreductase subunit G
MPTFKLDDRELPFEKGDTIIRAAHRQGIEIPHYCWHPGLSVAANCRMCLVEIEPPPGRPAMMLDIMHWDEAKRDWVPAKKPKLQPACQQEVSEGMVVRSQTSTHVAEARRSVQEFLLVNHPVDCPICDQAGECKLQDYWMSEGRQPKRMLDEPVHKPKGVVFSETIVYDAERCIACTRCIRVCDELAGDHALDLRERGNRFEVVLAPGRKLDGPYSLMTEHVCPVGALTSSHFRFKARVWTLRGSPGVCSGCATGCNTWVDADPRENRVYRLRPRDNEQVNKYWMCDDGMMTYERQRLGRVSKASVGRDSARSDAAVEDALKRAATELAKVPKGKLAVVLSAQATCEDNLVLAELARAVEARLYLSARGPWQADRILRSADANPNRAGAVLVGGDKVGSLQDLVASVAAGDVQGILGIGADADLDSATLAPLGRVGAVALFLSHDGPLARFATVTVPVCSALEAEGHFVNVKGLAQGFKRAALPREGVLPGWDAAARVGRGLGLELSYRAAREVRAALQARLQPPAKAADTTAAEGAP